MGGLELTFYILLPLQHIVELLRQQQFLEIFLEGTRSRSGKTSCARAGLLSVVVDTLSTNTIPDILIIPVGISYDRIIEGHYNGEQLVRGLLTQKCSSLSTLLLLDTSFWNQLGIFLLLFYLKHCGRHGSVVILSSSHLLCQSDW